MKGFGIEIKNHLLEPKHVENMGTAVWLYMYLIDKITSVNEDGVGKVLGGKPLKYSEVKDELGISKDTYTRWIKKLEEYPYIESTLAPYGYSFKVLKAYKRFRKNHEPKRFRKNHERNKDSNSLDSTTNVVPRKLVSDYKGKVPKDFLLAASEIKADMLYRKSMPEFPLDERIAKLLGWLAREGAKPRGKPKKWFKDKLNADYKQWRITYNGKQPKKSINISV